MGVYQGVRCHNPLKQWAMELNLCSLSRYFQDEAAAWELKHETVNHPAGEYVRDGFTTNRVEESPA